MTTINIPQKLIKEKELVVIPRKEYEKFLYIFKALSKDQWWFWTKEWQKKEKEADSDIRLKRVSGPYSNKTQLKAALNKLKK